MNSPSNLLEVRDLRTHFAPRGGTGLTVKAVDGVSFSIAPGQTLGLVGESGCGKSTVGRSILRLIEPTSGAVEFQGSDVGALSKGAMHAMRQDMQMVFQDPYSSLNPRMRASEIVSEPMRNYKTARGAALTERVKLLMQRSGLRPDQARNFPHEFSGGQRQRLGIARALALNPKLIVCDEAVSALDVSVQAQIVNLLMDLQDEMGLAYLFIAHDLAVVQHISHRVAVMYLGKIVEIADRRSLFAMPSHPYTKALIEAAPTMVPRRRKRILLAGDVPSAAKPPSGCRFHTRCPVAIAQCKQVEPHLLQIGPDHFAACHLVKTP